MARRILVDEGGFQVESRAVLIAGVAFTAEAVLWRRESLDLVLLVDTDARDHESIVFLVQAVARALDVEGSRRMLTVVCVGRPLDDGVATSLSTAGRVLSLEQPHSGVPAHAVLRDGLAVLLPFTFVLPSPQGEISMSWPSEREQLLAQHTDRIGIQLMSAAEDGVNEVEALLVQTLQEAFESRGQSNA